MVHPWLDLTRVNCTSHSHILSKEWERISEKRKLLAVINEITGIPNRLLPSEVELVVFSVAERMS
jgi:hypothetical protein